MTCGGNGRQVGSGHQGSSTLCKCITSATPHPLSLSHTFTSRRSHLYPSISPSPSSSSSSSSPPLPLHYHPTFCKNADSHNSVPNISPATAALPFTAPSASPPLPLLCSIFKLDLISARGTRVSTIPVTVPSTHLPTLSLTGRSVLPLQKYFHA